MKKVLLFFLFVLFFQFLQAQNFYDHQIPYTTDTTHLNIWNGSEYIPIFLKGVNLGVSVPGTFPGQLAATKEQYVKWFEEIKDAGFNNIRLYTLHYPRFYEALDSFNLANPQSPLLFFQGVWLNEEMPGYYNDLYFMTDTFQIEIEENVDCVHGNRTIPPRRGKAYGDYTRDVSKWCMGYIIGREVYPQEILTTDMNHPGNYSFEGEHFLINDASASEIWFTSKLDHLVNYEFLNYNTQRPVSASSWPTLDPLTHPEETNPWEDTASVDFSKIELTNAPAGLFISYHAYPYYPDFISQQSSYLEYYDNYGPNSYLGYLTELKSHYNDFPLIIAEYGVPSSWGIAHYATSGMNHGGFDELNQGETNIRMLNTIRDSQCGGGIQFAWIDEWFKRTWITDPIDYTPESRVLWHNIAAAEQNFGLIKFEQSQDMITLQKFEETSPITEIKADANYAFFELEVGLKNPLDIPDELWITFDTYAEDLGESQLPGGIEIPARAEFMLHITNYSAELYVTEAYDIYGIWHGITGPEQKLKSIPSDGAPWHIVRWKNNYNHSDVQYIGKLQVNYGFQNPSSKDAVTIFEDKLEIKIPWSLLNVVAPDKRKVLHDNKNTPEAEDTISDGFNIAVYYNSEWFVTDQRFVWDTWYNIDKETLNENKKNSYWVMKDRLHEFNTPAIAVRDSFLFENEVFPVTVNAQNGLLINDFDLDGNLMIPLLTEPPSNGDIQIFNDGSFTYQPNEGFFGKDSLKYCVFDGYSLSKPNVVDIHVSINNLVEESFISDKNQFIHIYPNPASTFVTIESKDKLDEILIFNESGHLIRSINNPLTIFTLDVTGYVNGTYIIVGRSNNKFTTKKLIKM